MGETERRIRELAARSGITADRGSLSDWTDKISELSGEDGQPADEVERLVINLGVAGVISSPEAVELQLAYMRERRGE